MQAERLALRREDLLRARLGSFDRLLGRTHETIQDALDLMERPYVAFSGGKDSTVLLDLVRQHDPEITAILADDELLDPQTVSFIDRTAGEGGLLRVQGWATHANWFRPWREQPYWRVPPADMVMIGQLLEPWSRSMGFDGVFIGLRADERARRHVHLASHGATYERADGQWQCNPLAWWDLADIWAYIASTELPYNRAYDVMTVAGIPREQQRVGPLALASGWVLQRSWPESYDALIARYGRRW